MQFQKLGLIFCVDGRHALQRHFAMLPTPVIIGDRIRIFYASTDNEMNGRVFSLDVDIHDPLRVIAGTPEIVLDVGSCGKFDQHGVNPICVVSEGGRLLLYYVGYDRSKSVPYTLFSGIAVSDNQGKSFERLKNDPVLPPVSGEDYFRTALYVMKHGSCWRGWYIGGNKWLDHNRKLLPIYSLCYCESSDGVIWGTPQVLMEPDFNKGQIGFGRPYPIIRAGGRLGLYLSIRTVEGYRSGYTESEDGINWSKLIIDVIPLSKEGWDSEMNCYAAPLVVEDREYVFYNGNGLGRTGFGVALRTE